MNNVYTLIALMPDHRLQIATFEHHQEALFIRVVAKYCIDIWDDTVIEVHWLINGYEGPQNEYDNEDPYWQLNYKIEETYRGLMNQRKLDREAINQTLNCGSLDTQAIEGGSNDHHP